MRTISPLEILGTAHGPLKRISPHARLVSALLVLLACVMVPLRTWILLVLMLSVFILLSGIPIRQLGRLLLFALILYVPLAIVMLLVNGRNTHEMTLTHSFPGPNGARSAEIMIKGIAGILLIGATLATTTLSSLYWGVHSLPFPRLFRSVVLQTLQQTAILVAQTRRIVQAIALRGGKMGIRDTLLLVRTFPSVWLLRLVYKSERVADAMEVRQYYGEGPAVLRSVWTRLDWFACIVSGAFVAASMLARFGVWI